MARLRILMAVGAVVAAVTVVAGPGSAAATGFVDVTAAAGLADPLYNSYVHAGAWGDIDNDGWADLFAGTFVTGPTQVPDKLFHNNSGTFSDVGQSAVEISGRASGALVVDLDGDGDDDILVSNNRGGAQTGAKAEPSRLLRNDAGAFVDVTASSGLAAQDERGRQAAVLDYDADGRLDLFIVADSFGSGGQTVLLRGVGNMQFVDVTATAGIPPDVHGLGLATGDLTGDGWPEIFVAGGRDLGVPNTNYLFVANGDGTYRNVVDHGLDWTPYTTGNEDWVSSGAMADLNRDGRLDLLVGHHFGSASQHGAGVPLRVYLNRGNDGSGVPIMDDVTSEIGLPAIDSKAPHVEIQDFDNDGWPDLYTSVTVDGQPLIFFHEGLTGGEPGFAIPPVANPRYYPVGPTADVDRDGRLDVFLGEFRSVFQGTAHDQGVVPSLLLRNEMTAGNWLDVAVPGPTEGIGTAIAIYENGKAGVASALLGYREIQVGNGFSSASLPVAHFGLGDQELVDVVATMPHGGPVVVHHDVEANQNFSVTEPSAAEPHLWLPLDEGSGDVAGDVSGHGLDGAIVGNPAWVVGHSGSALMLDGGGDRVELPGTALDGARDLTISMWIAPEAERSQTLLSAANPQQRSVVRFQLSRATRMQLSFGGTGVAWTFPSLADGRWHHVAVVHDAAAQTLELYIDGASRGTRTAAIAELDVTAAAIGAAQRRVGIYLTRQSWVGGIDDLQIYREALNAAAILELAG